MATKEAVFSLRVQTGNSVQDVQNFDKAVGNLNKDIKQVQQTAQQSTGIDSFDAKLQELNARVEAGGLTMRELTQTMKAYQTIAAQAGMESPVGQQAIQAAGQLKDQIGDLKAATTALSSDFVGLDTALAGIETGAAIFQGFQSAIALTGIENEKLVQTMVKLQAVQGVVNAVNTVAKNLNSDAILGIQLRTYWEKLYTFAVGESTGALKLFRIALLSTGIGAVIVGIGALIANFDSLKEMITGVTAEEQKLADQRKKNQQAQAEFISKESQGFATLIAQLKASNEGSKERSRLIEQINKQYGTTLKNLSDEAAFQNQLNKELENYLAFQKAKFQLQASEELIVANLRRQSQLKQQLAQDEKRLTELTKLGATEKIQGYQRDEFGISVATGLRYANQELGAEYENVTKRLKQNTTELEKAETRFENYGKSALKANQDIFTLTEGDTKYTETATNNGNKLTEQAEKRKEALEKIKAAEKEYSDSFLSQKQVEINSETKKYNDLIKLAEKYGYDTTTLQLALKNALNEINLKYAQIEIDTAQKIADDELKILQQQKEREEKIMSDMQAADDKAWDIEKSKMDLHAKYIKKEEDRAIAERQNAYQQELVDLQNALDKKLLTEEEYQNAVKVATQRFEEDKSKITMDADLERLDHMIQQAQKVKDMVGQIFQVITDFENIRLQEIENNTNAELAALDKKYQDELNKGNLNATQKAALDKNYAAAKYATELKAFNEMEKIKKRQFNRDKALRIAQVGIDTAAAVSKSVAASPLTFGMPWSAAAVGIGLAQIAAIAATKYESGTAPSLSTGGGAGVSAGASGSELGGAAVNGSLAGQQMSTAELVSQTNQGNVYVLESDITDTQNKVSTQNKLSVW